MHHTTKNLFACVVLLLCGAFGQAQQPKLTATDRASAINGILRCIRDGYADRETAKKIELSLREKEARKEYDVIEDGELLATQLTQDMYAIAHDLHLRVGYSPTLLPPEPKEPLTPPPGWIEEARRRFARDNFGFPRIEVLKGNVGYIECRYFAPLEVAAETYSAAMNTVSNTDALIFDLRGCTGSLDPETIPMLCGYFFAQPTHLDSIYWRHEDRTRQYWSAAHVSGKRYLNKPLYILTSNTTFSGAEAFAYNLKHLKRATIIGETTGGGANPGGTRRADDHFEVWVPFGRNTNPITGTNWEGVGVKPDNEVPAFRALHTAHKTALQTLHKTTEDREWKEILANVLAEVEAQAPRSKRITFTLRGYPSAKEVAIAGSFNHWSPRSHKLIRKGDHWSLEIEMETGRQPYKFIVDGEWMTDPANPDTMKDGPHTNSLRVVE